MPCTASCTCIEVVFARILSRLLSCLGSRCCTTTKAIPVSPGKASRSWLTASRPPADAPMPTTAKAPASSAGTARDVFSALPESSGAERLSFMTEPVSAEVPLPGGGGCEVQHNAAYWTRQSQPTSSPCCPTNESGLGRLRHGAVRVDWRRHFSPGRIYVQINDHVARSRRTDARRLRHGEASVHG